MEPKTAYSDSQATPSSAGALVVAWLFVGIPLIWGVSQTFIKPWLCLNRPTNKKMSSQSERST
jgi:hypothetical protein